MRRFECYKGRQPCANCDRNFLPMWNWQIYCGRRCYQFMRKFRERMRFDQHNAWKQPEPEAMPSLFDLELESYNRYKVQPRACVGIGTGRPHGFVQSLWLVMTLAVCLIISGCKTVKPQVEIPDPVGQKNVWLAYDGEKLVWLPITGGPSGAIDTTSHFGEIEMIPTATAKYLRSPVSYAKEPVPGQLVVYGPPGSSEQAVEASGMSAPFLKIDNGVLKVATAADLGGAIQHADYYPTANTNQGSATIANGWSMPPTGYVTLAAVNSPGGWRSGHMVFNYAQENAAYLETRLHPSWDKGVIGIDLVWWSGGTPIAGADIVRTAIDYACVAANAPTGNADPAWASLGTRSLTVAKAHTQYITAINSLSIPECVPGSLLRLRLRRLGLETADTFNATWLLDGVTLRWSQTL